jgi:hypothetical protein
LCHTESIFDLYILAGADSFSRLGPTPYCPLPTYSKLLLHEYEHLYGKQNRSIVKQSTYSHPDRRNPNRRHFTVEEEFLAGIARGSGVVTTPKLTCLVGIAAGLLPAIGCDRPSKFGG